MSAAPDLIDFSQSELSFLRNCSPLKHFDDSAFRTAVLSAKAGDLGVDERAMARWFW